MGANVSVFIADNLNTGLRDGNIPSATLNLGLTGVDPFQLQLDPSASSFAVINALRTAVRASTDSSILVTNSVERVTGGYRFTVETNADRAIGPSLSILVGSEGSLVSYSATAFYTPGFLPSANATVTTGSGWSGWFNTTGIANERQHVIRDIFAPGRSYSIAAPSERFSANSSDYRSRMGLPEDFPLSRPYRITFGSFSFVLPQGAVFDDVYDTNASGDRISLPNFNRELTTGTNTETDFATALEGSPTCTPLPILLVHRTETTWHGGLRIHRIRGTEGYILPSAIARLEWLADGFQSGGAAGAGGARINKALYSNPNLDITFGTVNTTNDIVFAEEFNESNIDPTSTVILRRTNTAVDPSTGVSVQPSDSLLQAFRVAGLTSDTSTTSITFDRSVQIEYWQVGTDASTNGRFVVNIPFGQTVTTAGGYQVMASAGAPMVPQLTGTPLLFRAFVVVGGRGFIDDAAYYPLHDTVSMDLRDTNFNAEDYAVRGFTHRGVTLGAPAQTDNDQNVTFEVAGETDPNKSVIHRGSLASISDRAFATIARTNEILVIGRQPNRTNVGFELSDSAGTIPSTELTVSSNTPNWRLVYTVNNPATFARLVTSANANELNYVAINEQGMPNEFRRQIPITNNQGEFLPVLAELSADDENNLNTILTVSMSRPYVSATDTINSISLTGPKAPPIAIPTLADGDTEFIVTFGPGVIVNEDLELGMTTTVSGTSMDYTIQVQGFVQPNNLAPLSAILDLETLELTMTFAQDMPRTIHRSVFESMLTDSYFNRFTLDNSGPGAQLFGIFNGVFPTSDSVDALVDDNGFITTVGNQITWTVTSRTIDSLRHWARFTTIQEVDSFQLNLRRPVAASPCGGSGVERGRIPLTFDNAAYCLEPCLPPASSPSALSGVKVTKLFPPNFSDQDYLIDRIEQQFGFRPTFQVGAYVFSVPIEGFNFSLLGYPNLLYFSDGGELVPPLSTVDALEVDNLTWSSFDIGLTSGISREDGRSLSETTIDNRDFRWVLSGSLVVLNDNNISSTLGTVLQAYNTNRPISFKIPSEVIEVGDGVTGVTVNGVSDRGQDLVTLDSTSGLTPDSWITFTDSSTTVKHTGETKVYTISDIVSSTQIRVWPNLIADIADNSTAVVGDDTRITMQIVPGSLAIETIPNNSTYKIINMTLQEVL